MCKAREYLSNQAKKASFALLTILRRLNHPPVTLALKLYESMVAPIMCYSSEIWGFTENMNLERVELGFLKAILNLPLSSPNMAVLGEIGQLPINLWWKEKILKYWDRLCNQDSPKLLRMAMQLSLENDNNGNSSWVGNVATILNNAGHSFSNTNNGCDIEQRNELMCVYRDQFIQKWHSNLAREHSVRGNGGNKLRTYRLFKKTFQFESYLDNINQRCYRVALTRFRVGAHALAVEVGRYHKPSPLPLGQRLCVFCNMVEDELHFLCICHKYNTLCKQLNEDIVRQFPEYRYLTTEQKFIFLMQTPHPYIHSTLSLFVYHAFKIRTCND